MSIPSFSAKSTMGDLEQKVDFGSVAKLKSINFHSYLHIKSAHTAKPKVPIFSVSKVTSLNVKSFYVNAFTFGPVDFYQC